VLQLAPGRDVFALVKSVTFDQVSGFPNIRQDDVRRSRS
jgi:hypothetical protein